VLVKPTSVTTWGGSVHATATVWALTLSQAYIFSDWSSPNTTTGAPFLLNGTAGFQLWLNGSGLATSATALSSPLAIQVADQLYDQSHSGTIDPNEVSSRALPSHVNSEVAKVDEAGLVCECSDAALNVDFTNNSTVTFRSSAANGTGLVLFEDAGLDPLSLRYCATADCSTSTLLFSGFSTGMLNTLLVSKQFGLDDSVPGIDQAFWFVFDQPVTGGYFKIGETDNPNSQSELLEVDFVGVTKASTKVPEPSSLLLLGFGLLGLSLLRRFQTR